MVCLRLRVVPQQRAYHGVLAQRPPPARDVTVVLSLHTEKCCNPGAAGARHHQAAGLMMAGARRPYKVLGVK